ncbi:fructosamine kinase family protein [Thiohalorhabdus methylotrophus]|uniref:Fructosamine kinase family protein n=1 Tax=Thiohalorhabdus methylotrophus TaxID=3242694 RepID=A0ABV4TXQ1_9GAMM
MPLPEALRQRSEEILGAPLEGGAPLSGGCVGEVYGVEAGGSEYVVKVESPATNLLETEGRMLRHLAERSPLPAPDPLHFEPGLLVMPRIDGDHHFTPAGEEHAADLFAALHAQPAPYFGFEYDTVIGGLPQPNPRFERWSAFFADARLREMAGQARNAGRLDDSLYQRIDRFAADAADWFPEPEHPALVHGDAWDNNIMALGDRITGFIDPALYWGHPEVELAFTTMFHTFSDRFYDRYHEQRPIDPEFFEVRRPLYNLYPLLVHVRLFGGGYRASVDRTLKRFGY